MHYLKCDNPVCDHTEVVNGPHEAYINKPCPSCGENLLTLEDYTHFQKLKAQYEVLIEMGILKYATEEDIRNNASNVISINPHEGKINITVNS